MQSASGRNGTEPHIRFSNREFTMKKILASTFFAMLFSASFVVIAAPATSAPSLTTCSMNTFKGTVGGSNTLKSSNGQPTFSWLWMEHWDGAGNSTWIEMDHYGTYSTGDLLWFLGPADVWKMAHGFRC